MGVGEAVAWGKVAQFLRVLSRNRVSRYAEYVDLNFTERDNDGWEFQAMHYTPTRVTPGNHP